jgi:hypothetical protein
MPLDSDIANGDTQLQVEFYTNANPRHGAEHMGKPWVRIMTPGDKTNIWDQPVRETDKQRFPRHWLFYQMKNSDGQVFGTSLAQWIADRPEDVVQNQIAELHVLGFRSVDQVAAMNDTQVQKVGIGAAGLREKAKAYLSGKNAVQNTEDREKLNRAESELAFLKTQMASLIERMNNQPAEPVKRGPGRPPGSTKVTPDVVNDAPTGDAGNQ